MLIWICLNVVAQCMSQCIHAYTQHCEEGHVDIAVFWQAMPLSVSHWRDIQVQWQIGILSCFQPSWVFCSPYQEHLLLLVVAFKGVYLHLCVCWNVLSLAVLLPVLSLVVFVHVFPHVSMVLWVGGCGFHTHVPCFHHSTVPVSCRSPLHAGVSDGLR